MSAVHAVGAQALLLGRTLASARREGLPRRAVLRHAAELGGGSGPLIAVGMTFFGAVLVSIAWAQGRRYVGDISIVGAPYFELIIREFAPLLTALLVASRAAASTAAEVGAMAVNEQLEALELSAADPLAELVAPRLWASVLTMPLLTALGTVAATASAVLTLRWGFGMDGSPFMDPRLIDGGDLACALVKALLNGVYIPLAAARRGLEARGGAAAVGEAVTLGVVDASMGCLVIDFGVAVAFRLVGA